MIFTRRIKLSGLSAALIILLFSYPVFAVSDADAFKEIKKLFNAGKKEELISSSNKFFKDFPKSNLTADVRFILAENESDPKKAIDQYRLIIDKYAYFKMRDTALERICGILYLESRWGELEHESGKAARIFTKSLYYNSFRIYRVKALIHLERFDDAKKTCMTIIKTDHDYESLGSTLLLLTHINKNIYGYSKSYLESLNEIITGFDKSGSITTALYLLGLYYEKKEAYDKAFSAYSDIVLKFPNSPEAGLSKTRIESLKRFNPSRTAYLPDKESLKKAEAIDIEPETDAPEEKINENNIDYAISLGPFDNIKSAREIKDLINKDFEPVEIAEIRTGFSVYAGRFSTVDSAIRTKIRLAEEFGINGRVVKIVRDSKRLYIYEE